MADTMTITETAADGTTTVIEITESSDQSTLIEDVIEALTDDGADAAFEAAPEDADVIEIETEEDLAAEDFELASDQIAEDVFNNGEFELAGDPIAAEVFGGGEFNLASDQVAEDVFGEAAPGTFFEEIAQPSAFEFSVPDTVSTAPAFESVSDATNETMGSEDIDPAVLETQAHADAARDAQEAATEFVAAGDYAAAAEARAIAENEAWEAGDNYILEGSNATDLESAAQQQENAEYYQAQQDEFAKAGDYEAAAEAAGNAAHAIGNADWHAGGSDHTGQAETEEYQLDYAVWEENNAEYYAHAAEQFAADGNLDAAADYAESAVESQNAADYHADTATGGVYDSTSVVETGGSYEAADYTSSYDYSATDTATE